MVVGLPVVGVEVDGGGQVVDGRGPLLLLGVGLAAVQAGHRALRLHAQHVREVVDRVVPAPGGTQVLLKYTAW